MHFIKDIPTSILRKARVLRLLGSTMNYTQGSYNCILQELTYSSQHQSWDVGDHIALQYMKNQNISSILFGALC